MTWHAVATVIILKAMVIWWLVSAILFVGTCEPHACAWFVDEAWRALTFI